MSRDTTAVIPFVPVADEKSGAAGAALLRIAHMFAPHRRDELMRELCRLAVKCAQEGAVRDA
jgi:hypothetical protein